MQVVPLGGVVQWPPIHGRGEDVPTDSEGLELVTEARGWQDGPEVGFRESTQI